MVILPIADTGARTRRRTCMRVIRAARQAGRPRWSRGHPQFAMTAVSKGSIWNILGQNQHSPEQEQVEEEQVRRQGVMLDRGR